MLDILLNDREVNYNCDHTFKKEVQHFKHKAITNKHLSLYIHWKVSLVSLSCTCSVLLSCRQSTNINDVCISDFQKFIKGFLFAVSFVLIG